MTVGQEGNGTQQVSFFVSSEVWEAIKEKAAREDRPAAYVAKRALEREAARKR